MAVQAVFLFSNDEVEVDQQTAQEFLLLFQQSVLLSLKTQGTIDEMQCRQCLILLSNQFAVKTEIEEDNPCLPR